jgi:molybdate transport system substrate-binding protein
VLSVLLFGVMLSCGTGGETHPPELMIFAAASTSDAVRALAVEFEKAHLVRVRCNFASSATLAQQIRAGARADLFLSAHPEWVGFLEDENLVLERTDLLGNALVIVVPATSMVEKLRPEDLLNPQFRLISAGAPDSVPAGTYARKAMQRLGLWTELLPRIVSAVDVRQALAYVESGEVDAGFVYSTDAAISSRVRVACRLGSDLTGEIRYPLVLLAGHSPEALDLFEFACSNWSRQNFRHFGFEVNDLP